LQAVGIVLIKEGNVKYSKITSNEEMVVDGAMIPALMFMCRFIYL
jgi:hypothetical protein